jgi:hypothetical protein
VRSTTFLFTSFQIFGVFPFQTVPVELIWTLLCDVAPARAPGAPACVLRRCVPREVPLRHVEPSPSPSGHALRYPSVPAVLPLCGCADQCHSSYCGLKAGVLLRTRARSLSLFSPSYKTAVVTLARPHECRPPELPHRHWHTHGELAFGLLPSRTNPLSPSPHTSTPPRVVSRRALPSGSPFGKPSRPGPPWACRPSSPPPPSPATNGSLVVRRPSLYSSPAGLRRALAGFEAGPPPATPTDPIARGVLFSRVGLQSRDLLVRNLKLSGASLKRAS